MLVSAFRSSRSTYSARAATVTSRANLTGQRPLGVLEGEVRHTGVTSSLKLTAARGAGALRGPRPGGEDRARATSMRSTSRRTRDTARACCSGLAVPLASSSL